ncbi:MAG TPA: site-specific integrase [Candidatus Aminicenantes bacterium]|nr:site-specific integrase [Candidatus Aminicenantes bacterium]
MASKTGYRVRKRGDTYFVDFRLPGIQRFRRSLKTGNAEEAHSRAAAIYKRISRMVAGGSRPDLQLREAIDRYLFHGEKTRTASSLGPDRTCFRRILEWFPDNVEIRNIDRSSVLEFTSWMKKDRNYSQRTVNHHIAVAKAAINLALADKIYSGDNPFAGRGLIKQVRTRRKSYSPAQLSQILEYARNISASGGSLSRRAFHPYIYLAVNTGMRPGEILNLRWDHITPQQIEIHRPKSGQDLEVIPMLPWVWDFLQKLPRESFYVLHLGQRSTNTFRKIWIRLRTDLKLPEGSTLYQIRHSVASYLADAGVPLHLVQALLRHADWSTTQIYVNSDMDDLRRVMAVMDRFKA